MAYLDGTGLEEALTKIKAYITGLLNGKQDKLTAGDNITISGNVISATGGEGSASVDWEKVADYQVLTGDWAISDGNNTSICADADEADDAFANRPTFDDIVIESKTGSGKNVNANGTVQLTVSTTKSGYKCLGVLGWTLNGTNSHFCYPYEININDTSNIVSGRFRNLATASTTLTLTARLLYIRTK